MPRLGVDMGHSQQVEGSGPSNKIKTNVAQCQIIWYEWDVEDDFIEEVAQDDFDTLSDTTAYDISENLIDSCTFSKSRSSSFGSFAFRLDNSRDWKNIIKPGQWCTIFMSNDGDLPIASNRTEEGLVLATESLLGNKLRGICYIERISSNTAITENGSTDVFYEVSGRDFGVIYDETSLWFNSFTYDEIILKLLRDSIKSLPRKSLNEYLELVHDFFFSPERRTELKSEEARKSGITDLAKQWILPKRMLQDLSITVEGASFFGNINNLRDFEETTFTVPVMLLTSSLKGRVWDKFNEIAVTPHFHELFTETDADGKPKLIFRPIPWGLKQEGYGDLNVPLYKNFVADEVNLVKLEAIDIFSMDVGNDNHERYNHFLVTTMTDQNSHIDSLELLNGVLSAANKTFPYQKIQSVRRHGFRPNHANINSNSVAFSGLTGSNANKNGKPDPGLLIKYNELLTDYWQYDVFFESGTFEINGNNEVKLGKVLDIGTDVPYNANKVFYIEEYSDNFSIDQNGATSWTQTIAVTRGIEKEALNNDIIQTRRFNRFKDAGTYIRDSSFNKGKK